MPFIPHTPESLIPRSDSKNPATTCKGITSSGRPCRRSLAASPRNSPITSPSAVRGVIAVLSDFDDNHDRAAVFYCWQHKEQATTLASCADDGRTKVVELLGKPSIETLVNRIGVLDVQENGQRKKKRSSRGGQQVERGSIPRQWQNVPGPWMTVPDPCFDNPAHKEVNKKSRPRAKRDVVHFSFFCCMKSADLDDTPGSYIRPSMSRPAEMSSASRSSQRPIATMPPSAVQSTMRAPLSSGPSARRPNSVFQTPTKSISLERPSIARDPSSHTQTLLSLIPASHSPQMTSRLFTELAKPLTAMDHEPGYIYIFWLTLSTADPPSPRAANSLLTSPSIRPSTQGRRTSELLNDFATHKNSSKDSQKIMLKIGRASNVQRRLNEWSRQCNYNLSLIRYYPYHSPSPVSTPSTATVPPALAETPRKVPHVQRVERLIHLELGEKRIKRLCGGCGKEHREWFEVEATEAGVRAVDEVVRRWVGWGEQLDGK